jgi:replicative DNA helicase
MNEIIAIATALMKDSFLRKLVQLPDEVFQNYKNQEVLRSLKELAEKHEKIDIALLLSHMQAKNKTPDNDYVEKLLNSKTSLNPDGLIREIRQAYNNRQITVNAGKLFELTRKGEIDNIDEFVDNIIKLKSNEENNDSGELSDFSEISLDDIYKKGTFYKTGFWPLDENILGLFKGQLITIAATPGNGKTTFAFQAALNIGDAVMFSMEMKRHQLYAKYLSMKAEVEVMQIYSKKLNDEEMKRILNVQKDSASLNLRVYDCHSNLYYILNAIKDEVRNNGKKIIFIDYLQLITDAPGYDTNSRLEYTTRSLKLLAFQLDIPIVILSQLTKDVAKENRKPSSGDLRGSGAIHQDSDVVIFIWESEEQTVFTVDKCREGKRGDVNDIKFQKEYSRFTTEIGWR